ACPRPKYLSAIEAGWGIVPAGASMLCGLDPSKLDRARCRKSLGKIDAKIAILLSGRALNRLEPNQLARCRRAVPLFLLLSDPEIRSRIQLNAFGIPKVLENPPLRGRQNDVFHA